MLQRHHHLSKETSGPFPTSHRDRMKLGRSRQPWPNAPRTQGGLQQLGKRDEWSLGMAHLFTKDRLRLMFGPCKCSCWLMWGRDGEILTWGLTGRKWCCRDEGQGSDRRHSHWEVLEAERVEDSPNRGKSQDKDKETSGCRVFEESRKGHPSRSVPSISSFRKISLASGCALAPKVATAHVPIRLLHNGCHDPPNLVPDHLPSHRVSFPKSAPTAHLQALPPPGWPPCLPFYPSKLVSILLNPTQMPPFRDTILRPSFRTIVNLPPWILFVLLRISLCTSPCDTYFHSKPNIYWGRIKYTRQMHTT